MPPAEAPFAAGRSERYVALTTELRPIPCSI